MPLPNQGSRQQPGSRSAAADLLERLRDVDGDPYQLMGWAADALEAADKLAQEVFDWGSTRPENPENRAMYLAHTHYRIRREVEPRGL